MAGIQFDLDGARKAGFTDDQIAESMASKANFDVAGARKVGFTSAQIIGRLMDPTPPKTARDTLLQQNAEDTGVVQSALVGAGHTFDRIGKGMQQGYYALTGDDKAAADLKKRADEEEALYAPLRKAHPIATGVGESLPAMAVPVGGATATVGAAAARMGASAAVSKGLEYGDSEERAKAAALAGTGAAIGGVVIPKAASAMVQAGKAGLSALAGKISPEAYALYDKAKQFGIPVNLAQLSDSKFLKTLASSLQQIPFTGAAKAAATQRTAFTNAVSKTFGDDVEKITPEVYAANKKRLGDTFNDLTQRNNLNIDGKLSGEIKQVADSAAATGSDDTNNAIRNILGRIDEQGQHAGGNIPPQTSPILGPNGQPIVTTPASSTPAVTTIPGSTYQSIDTELTNMIKAGGEKGLYAKNMRETLRNGMDRSIAPADQEAWQTARSQYRNLKAVRDIVAKDMGNGDIPPTALSNALNRNEAGKESMAMGARGDLGELSQIGRQFVRDQIPDSYTGLRQIALGVAGGGAAAGGTHGLMSLGALAAGGATTGRLIQHVMSNPKTVDALRRQGISMSDLMRMPPSRLTQLIGGSAGFAATDQQKED